MIVLIGFAIDDFQGNGISVDGTPYSCLHVDALWLEKRKFSYSIDKDGIKLIGLGNPKFSRLARKHVKEFWIVKHGLDTFTIFLLSDRYFPTRIHKPHLFQTQLPLERMEVGTAFGIGNAAQLAKCLVDMEYEVRELDWWEAIEKQHFNPDHPCPHD